MPLGKIKMGAVEGEGISSAKVVGGDALRPIIVPQVNASKAYQWLDEGASAQIAGIQEGLKYYLSSLEQARTEMSSGYAKANATLQPMAFAATQALNEQMRMMGLAPLSASQGLLQEAKDRGLSASVQSKLTAAENLKDPQARAQALADIQATISTDNQSNLTKAQALKEQAGGYSTLTPQQKLVLANAANISNGKNLYSTFTAAGISPQGYGSNAITDQATNQSLLKDAQAAQARDAAKAAELTGQASALEAQNLANSEFGQMYGSTYTSEYDSGYTGDQVEARVASTPGYQFQMEQGTKAIERQGAAKGMLGSGNTLTALTQYGQGLAQNFYGMYMDNLSRIVAQGSGAVNQISANQAAEGNTNAQMTTQGGQAQMATSADAGAVRNQAATNKANMFVDVAKYNSSMQYQGFNDELTRQNNLAMAAVGAAPGMAQAGVAQQKFNYGVAQNQQGGQQFYA